MTMPPRLWPKKTVGLAWSAVCLRESIEVHSSSSHPVAHSQNDRYSLWLEEKNSSIISARVDAVDWLFFRKESHEANELWFRPSSYRPKSSRSLHKPAQCDEARTRLEVIIFEGACDKETELCRWNDGFLGSKHLTIRPTKLLKSNELDVSFRNCCLPSVIRKMKAK